MPTAPTWRDIQDLLGHSKLDTTSAIYTASAPNRLRAAVDSVNWGATDKDDAIEGGHRALTAESPPISAVGA
jgi:hypothetical protein